MPECQLKGISSLVFSMFWSLFFFFPPILLSLSLLSLSLLFITRLKLRVATGSQLSVATTKPLDQRDSFEGSTHGYCHRRGVLLGMHIPSSLPSPQIFFFFFPPLLLLLPLFFLVL
eukprot:TRINITY_DN4252_c11_g1_i1.p2 TRINITY_DN4252_c11_g1~~TRINITY_DN4252_c11_g1_i1.p2  ORF type:complete len:116 (+),score=4.27 TRINITY_DN4252_c11_g1_i1:168-515(+)